MGRQKEKILDILVLIIWVATRLVRPSLADGNEQVGNWSVMEPTAKSLFVSFSCSVRFLLAQSDNQMMEQFYFPGRAQPAFCWTVKAFFYSRGQLCWELSGRYLYSFCYSVPVLVAVAVPPIKIADPRTDNSSYCYCYIIIIRLGSSLSFSRSSFQIRKSGEFFWI